MRPVFWLTPAKFFLSFNFSILCQKTIDLLEYAQTRNHADASCQLTKTPRAPITLGPLVMPTSATILRGLGMRACDTCGVQAPSPEDICSWDPVRPTLSWPPLRFGKPRLAVLSEQTPRHLPLARNLRMRLHFLEVGSGGQWGFPGLERQRVIGVFSREGLPSAHCHCSRGTGPAPAQLSPRPLTCGSPTVMTR